jgi:histidine triad (HIT) family protein
MGSVLWVGLFYGFARFERLVGSVMAAKTLFQKIADREIPADLVFEDDRAVAFRDINPVAPVHILIVPREPISGVDALTGEHESLVGYLFTVARRIAAEEGLENGYRLVLNCGKDGQQTVPHLHIHLMGGRQLTWPPG